MGATENDLLDQGGQAEDLDGPLQLRQAYNRLRQETGERESAAEKRGLEAGREQARREIGAEQLATSLGFNAQFGATYLRSAEGVELTEQGMRTFAESLGVPIPQRDGGGPAATTEEPPTNEVPPGVADAAKDFSPQDTGGQTSEKMYSAQEWMDLYQNPNTRAEADRIAKAGLVVLKHNVSGSGTIDRPYP